MENIDVVIIGGCPAMGCESSFSILKTNSGSKIKK